MADFHTQELDNLFEALMTLNNVQEYYQFFEDVCTIREMQEISQRLEVARLLEQKMVYNDIAKKTGASTATISRVNRCLSYGSGGYRIVLDRMKPDIKAE